MQTILIFIPWIICLFKSYKDKELFRKNISVMLVSASILFFIGLGAHLIYTPSSQFDFTLLPLFMGIILVFFGIGIARLIQTMKHQK
jgi:hypothetical protein